MPLRGLGGGGGGVTVVGSVDLGMLISKELRGGVPELLVRVLMHAQSCYPPIQIQNLPVVNRG